MPMSKEEEEDLEHETMALNRIKAQLETLLRQKEVFEMAFTDLDKAVRSLKDMESLNTGHDILVPLGGECFIGATAKDTKKALIGIGGRIYMERPVGEAIELLNKRMEMISTSNQKLDSSIEELEMRGQALSQKIQEAYSRMEEEPAIGME
jgi:prefoldin alpha subunit